jgi:nitrate/TMAO reductase-like tetraheme cytochrome c subunit
VADARSVVGAFDPRVVYDRNGTRAEAYREGGGFRFRAVAPVGQLHAYPVDFVAGGRRMQDCVTRFPDGRLQVLPIYFHVTGREWVDYTTLKQGRLDSAHPFFWSNYARTFNKECLSCHATGEAMGWNEEAGRFETTWVDAGVACEKCHGPGERHAREGGRGTIVRPSALPADRLAAVCAQCHAARAPWRSAFSPAARFVPGERFSDVFEPVTPTLGPGDLSGDFWLDGRPSAGSFESAALAQSACARKGGVTCLTCHEPPHGKGGLSEMKASARTGEVCLGCHTRFRDPSAARAHHGHEPGRPGSGCADCHMPKTVVGVLDPQADHSIDVPNPENMRDFAIPDACTSCHAKRGPAWAIGELERRFPRSSRRSRRQRLALAQALWRDGRPEAGAAFARILSDAGESELMRANAATALGSVRRGPAEGEAGASLVLALDDASDVIAARAARSLGTRKERGAIDALARAATGPRSHVALPAALNLLELGHPRGREIVESLLRRKDLVGDYRLETALAILDLRAGRPEPALSHARRALADRPDFVPARELASGLAARLAQPEEAARQKRLAALFRHDAPGGR